MWSRILNRGDAAFFEASHIISLLPSAPETWDSAEWGARPTLIGSSSCSLDAGTGISSEGAGFGNSCTLISQQWSRWVWWVEFLVEWEWRKSWDAWSEVKGISSCLGYDWQCIGCCWRNRWLISLSWERTVKSFSFSFSSSVQPWSKWWKEVSEVKL